MNPYKSPATSVTIVAAALLGAIVLAAPAYAGAATDAPRAPIQVAAGSSNQRVAEASSSETSETMKTPASESSSHASVETRIDELHRKLKITPAQKRQWDAVAQVMRENAEQMESLEKQRAAESKSMDAVDAVKSYEQVVQAHEDGIKKFLSPFEDLYNSMSESQKKTADSMFRGKVRAAAKKQMSKAGS